MQSHFNQYKDSIKQVFLSHHFHHDLKDFNPDIILKSESQPYLHKFEETIEGNHIFRALIDKVHIVYAINKNHDLIFLRAFHNFKEYGKFLDHKKDLLHLINKI